MNEAIRFKIIKNDVNLFGIDYKRSALWIECAALFLALPVVIFFYRHFIAFRVIPCLLILMAICAVVLWRDEKFDKRIFWRTEKLKHHLQGIMAVFLPGAVVTLGLVYFQFHDRFLVFPKSEPYAWLGFVVIYPLLSALPQELIFKCFFFHRYSDLFRSPTALILFNGVSFSLAHLWYDNLIAPLYTLFGGMLFAYRYHQSKSLIIVSIEHGLWGLYLYAVGLGWFFYSGSIQ